MNKREPAPFMIGDQVRYVHKRAKTEIKDNAKVVTGHQIVEGEGIVRAICVDHTKRLVVQIADETDVFNVDYNAINPTPEFVEKFTVLCENIAGYTAEAKKKQSEIVQEYNAKIDEICDELLGEKVEIEYVKGTEH